jgi:hypothetical protein
MTTEIAKQLESERKQEHVAERRKRQREMSKPFTADESLANMQRVAKLRKAAKP